MPSTMIETSLSTLLLALGLSGQGLFAILLSRASRTRREVDFLSPATERQRPVDKIVHETQTGREIMSVATQKTQRSFPQLDRFPPKRGATRATTVQTEAVWATSTK